jgi:hypothetical protein
MNQKGPDMVGFENGQLYLQEYSSQRLMPKIGPFMWNMLQWFCPSWFFDSVWVLIVWWKTLSYPIISLYMYIYPGEMLTRCPCGDPPWNRGFPLVGFRFLPRGSSIYGHLTAWSWIMTVGFEYVTGNGYHSCFPTLIPFHSYLVIGYSNFSKFPKL